jgi:superfamily II DNA or RNA helicase
MLHLQENATQLFITGPDSDLRLLVDEFRFRPDGYYYTVTYQQYQKSDGAEGWDGYIYPFKQVKGDMVIAPRGRKEDLFRYAKAEGVRLDTSGLLENPFTMLEIDDIRPDLIAGSFALDQRQRECILNWVQEAVGINKVTVGGGKTATFAGTAAFIKEHFPDARFIYITPSERLVRQAAKEMRRMLPQFDIGQCGGGHHEFEAKDMVICTVSMLSKHFVPLVQEGWFETFMAILYDEVHHAASPTSKKILEVIPAYFRLGASDTAKEKDKGKFYTIRGLFGPKLTEVKSDPLIREGRLAKPHIYIVDLKPFMGKYNSMEHRAPPDSDAYVLMDGQWLKGIYRGPVYEKDEFGEIKMRSVKTAELDEDTQQFVVEQKPVIAPGMHRIEIDKTEFEIDSRWCLLERVYDRAIIRFKSRNELVVRWTNYFHRRGWPTVVVATRTTHVYILEALLNKAIPRKFVRILTGYEKDSPEQRDAMFAWFKATPGAVLITPLIKEGVSINEIAAMVVADHVADHEVAKQIIGRAMRPKKDNRAHVVWFWDRQNKVLSTGCRNLLEFLEVTAGFSYYHPVYEPEDVFERKP